MVRDVYGYDPGGRPASAATPEGSERTLVKLDWNAGEAHRASWTYQRSRETGTSVAADRLASAWIDVPVDLSAYTVQLFSDWNDRASTTLRANLKTFERGQNCRAQGVGALEFDNLDADSLAGTALDGLLTGRAWTWSPAATGSGTPTPTTTGACRLFGALDYLLGDHVLRVGGEYESFDLFNLFLPSSNGRFVFRDFAAITSRTARVDYVNVPSNDVHDGAAAWDYGKTSLFVQDTWQVRPNLQLTAGFATSASAQDDPPAFNRPSRRHLRNPDRPGPRRPLSRDAPAELPLDRACRARS